MSHPIYLDHAATTPLDPRVAEVMVPFLHAPFGNPSSIHSFGREARAALEEARAVIARAVGARPGEIVFTSGGTEADNLAIAGAARAARGRGRSGVLTTAAEHHAVLDTCRRLEEGGFDVTVLPVDASGVISLNLLRESLTPRAAVVSAMLGNNETGALSPVREIADGAHAAGALLHTDAVQAVGKIPVNVDALGADLLTLTAHKLGGPKGIGALYIRRGTEVRPLLTGGGQERGTRPGTESVALAAGFARAVDLAVGEMEEERARLASLRDALQRAVTEEFSGAIVNGASADRLPHILSVSFDSRITPMEGEMLVVNMDLLGVAVSSGSACTSGSVRPSHVLLAMGRDEATAKATLRFSFGRGNTAADIPAVMEALRSTLARMTGR